MVDGERRPDRTSTELSTAFARTVKKSATSSSSSSSSSKGKANDASPLVALVVDQQEKCPRRTLSTKTEVVRPQPFRCLSFPQRKSQKSRRRRPLREGSRALVGCLARLGVSRSPLLLLLLLLWAPRCCGALGRSVDGVSLTFFEEEEEALCGGKNETTEGEKKERKVHTFH